MKTIRVDTFTCTALIPSYFCDSIQGNMYCQGAADTEAQSCLRGKYKGVFISPAMAPMNI